MPRREVRSTTNATKPDTETLQQNQPMIMAWWTLMNAGLGNPSTDSGALEDVVKTSERLFEMLEDDILEIQRIMKSLL